MAAFVALPLTAMAGLLTSADEVARAWIGHDATDLLMQWPVDADANFSTTEDTTKKETTYRYRVINAAYTTTETWSESTGRLIGVYPGNGPNPVQVPIYEQQQFSRDIYHPAELICDFSFVANSQGIIDRYQVNGGEHCSRQLRKWGVPE